MFPRFSVEMIKSCRKFGVGIINHKIGLQETVLSKMLSACILIRTERGKFDQVAKRLKQIEGVKSAFPVLGRYDVVVDVEAKNSKLLGRAILKTNHLAGVVFTETLPEVEE